MNTILSLDLGNNSIGWTFRDPSTGIIKSGVRIFSQSQDRRSNNDRRLLRMVRRSNQRAKARLLFILRNCFGDFFYEHSFIDKLKKLFPLFVHTLLACMFITSLIMAVTNSKDFQFWLNLSVTILLEWIAWKNKNNKVA